MQEVITRLKAYIDKLHAHNRKPFYLLVDTEGHALHWQGSGAHYGFDEIQRSDNLAEKLLFLVGLEETSEIATRLPHMDMGNGISAEIHSIRLKNAWGLAFLDVTEEVLYRQRYQQLAHELSLAQEQQKKLMRELDHANQLKTQFIGRMSHEFRTPLSSIMGFAELAAEDQGDTTRFNADIAAIKRGAQYLLNMVDNLLDQAVLENNELTLRPAACDVHALVESLEELFQPTARQRGLSLAWWVGPDMPERIWLDEMRLRQILVNLIGNAIKYTNEGGITVSLEWAQEQLKLEVEDTGRGIKQEELESLFEPFNQGSDSKNAKRGAGLGLSISREIARRLGGDLYLTSKPGHGTQAHCSLPAGARLAQEPQGGALEGKNILVLEPDQDTLNLVEIYLSAAGSSVSQAADMETLLARLANDKPDLVMMGLRGDQRDANATQRIRTTGYPGPLIAIGTREDRDNYRDILNQGFDDLLTKPFNRTDLVRNLGAFLQLATH